MNIRDISCGLERLITQIMNEWRIKNDDNKLNDWKECINKIK